jgi:hypothetical protein
MLFLLLFAFVTNTAVNGTQSYDECKQDNFRLKNACSNSKTMHDIGKKGCEIQGKKFPC